MADKEVHYHDSGSGGGSGAGAMLGVIGGIVVAAIALFLVFGYARNDNVALKAPTIEKSVPAPSTGR